MFCENCGKELLEGAKFCPVCGAEREVSASPYGENQAAVPKAPYNMMCILGVVISGISLLLNFWGLVGIAGTVVSLVGLLSCQQKKERGKALAIIGIAIGAYSILYGVGALISLM